MYIFGHQMVRETQNIIIINYVASLHFMKTFLTNNIRNNLIHLKF